MLRRTQFVYGLHHIDYKTKTDTPSLAWARAAGSGATTGAVSAASRACRYARCARAARCRRGEPAAPASSASVKSIFVVSRSTRATLTRTRPASWNTRPAALADHRVAPGVEVEVVAAELGDVDEAVDVEVVERDEDAEARHAADRAVEALADLVLHEVALEPVLDVARRVVGAPLGERAVHAELGPRRAAGLVLACPRARP